MKQLFKGIGFWDYVLIFAGMLVAWSAVVNFVNGDWFYLFLNLLWIVVAVWYMAKCDNEEEKRNAEVRNSE